MSGTAIPNEADEVRSRLLETVIELLEEGGYDAVQLREVARRTRMSLSTVYKRFATREELILAAIEHWMKENHAGLVEQPRAPGERLHPAMMRVIRAIFEPWEKNPAMLLAYFRVRTAPGWEGLHMRGFDEVIPVGMAVLEDVDPVFVEESMSILSSVVFGLVGRCLEGQIELADIMPTIDRAVYWLTTGYEATEREERGQSA
ncbi:TetR family transcriptional regulator [Rhodococcus rhodochrous J38]|uniref:TetR family transcriptional regulator n=1 Tax=Rhodococcus rhodochrous TaxID=1829 RepID=UPI00119EF68C|nr:TetR family transcriptional regulator [Rhodococcus rhodochrous]TWH37441.1 TetR family transcriptional regulator [Rhodococcus rhodochrous J38]